MPGRGLSSLFGRYPWLLILVSALLCGVLGGIVSTTNSAPWDKIVASLASIGSLGAAFATYATVREMRATRVVGSRARITPRRTQNLIEYIWTANPKNIPPTVKPLGLVARNASQGVAKNAQGNWAGRQAIDNDTVNRLQAMCPTGAAVSIAAGGHIIDFFSKGTLQGRLLVGHKDHFYLGDVGSSQEETFYMPAAILNNAFIIWCCMLMDVADGMPILPEEVPAYDLYFSHNSLYEADLIDNHTIRLHLHSYEFFKGRKSLQWLPGCDWDKLKIILRVEVSSDDIDKLPSLAA